jgi:hypothetical protein
MPVEVSLYSLGDPGTFDITDKDDPMYYVARFNHEMSVNFYNLQQAGWEFRQSSDKELVDTLFDGLIGINGSAQEYPYLALLGSIVIEVLLNQTGDLQSLFFGMDED